MGNASNVSVLLLRPHDFIVDDMSAWVRRLGHEPIRFRSLEQLDQTDPTGVVAGVISLAVSSDVKASVREVLIAARARVPQLPILLTSLSSLEKARPTIELELKGLGITAHGADAAVAWGSPAIALYTPAADLKGAGEAALTAAARKHFRR